MHKLIFGIIMICFNSSVWSRDIWIDYDIAFGKYTRDVDDGYALVGALKNKNLNIVGISLVYGNTNNLDYMVKATRKILKRFHAQHIPLYLGAGSKKDLGKNTAASQALITALEDKPLTILAMGRLTNIATVIKLRPDLASQVKDVLIMGGRQESHSTKVGRKGITFSDVNIDGDIESVRILIDSDIPKTLIPVEAMKHNFVSKWHLNILKKGPKNLRWLKRRSGIWRLIWKFYPGLPGFIPWDLFLVSYLTHPQDFSCIESLPVKLHRMKNDTDYTRGGNNASFKEFLAVSSGFQTRAGPVIVIK